MAVRKKADTSPARERGKSKAAGRQSRPALAELDAAAVDLRHLLVSSEIATLWLDRGLRVKWFTPAAREVLDIGETDAGRPLRDLDSPLAGESLGQDARRVLDQLAPAEAELQAASGRWYLRRTLPLRRSGDRVDGVVVTFADITDSRRRFAAVLAARESIADALEHLVDERTRQLRELAAELALAEDRERRSLARDLHDDLGQVLNLVRLKLEQWMSAHAAVGRERDAELAEVIRLVDEAGRGVHSLAAQLSPPILEELGLVPALEWLAEQIQRSYGVAVEIRDDGAEKPLDPARRSVVFRAARELLINVARHADVARAQVEIRRDGGNLLLTVDDAGRGFERDRLQMPHAAGLGLVAVRERLITIGGDAAISSAPGKGTRVRLRVPLVAASGAAK